MLTGAFVAPVTAFVLQSVVLYVNVAGIPVASAMPTAQASVGPPLMIVANSVAVLPTITDRFAGSIAAASAVGAGSGEHTQAPPLRAATHPWPPAPFGSVPFPTMKFPSGETLFA